MCSLKVVNRETLYKYFIITGCYFKWSERLNNWRHGEYIREMATVQEVILLKSFTVGISVFWAGAYGIRYWRRLANDP